MSLLDFPMLTHITKMTNTTADLMESLTRLIDDLRILLITASVTGYIVLLIFGFVKLRQCSVRRRKAKVAESQKRTDRQIRWKPPGHQYTEEFREEIPVV